MDRVMRSLNVFRFLQARHGATAVEFALAIGAFLTLVLASVDLSLFSFEQQRLQAAARAAARTASTTPVVAESFRTASDGYAAGEVVPAGDVADVTCTGRSGSFTCDRGGVNQSAAQLILASARRHVPDLAPSELEITYSHIGLGRVGDAIGFGMDPAITVTITGRSYRPLSLAVFESEVALGRVSVTFNAEDMS